MTNRDEFGELDELVQSITTGLETVRSRLGAWMESGPGQSQCAESGGVVAEATLASGLTDIQIDRSWLEGVDVDEVARCVVEAVNDAEAACRAQVWTALGDIRLGDVSVADLGDPGAQRRLESSPADFFASFTATSRREENS